jgi:Outer membrane protein beta-barrel domain
MNSKRILSLLSVIITSAPLMAQVDFGVIAGPQMTSAKYTIRSTKQETEGKFGFILGGTMRAQFEGRLYFAPAVFYSMKGYKVALTVPSYPPDSGAVDNDVTLHTFEIAPMLQYNFSEGPGHFFIKAGPSIDIQISGKEKFNTVLGATVDRKMKFSYGDYGHFGANLILQAGYESSAGYLFAVQYTHGVGSIVNTDNGPTVSHRVIGITIGKYFKKD